MKRKGFTLFSCLLVFFVLANFVACSNGLSDDTPQETILVTYDLNYEGAPEVKTVPQVKNASFTLKSFNRDGYRLVGWADSNDSSDVKYSSGSSVRLSKDHTFYAIWADSNAVVALTLNSNMESGSETVCYVPAGTTYRIPANTFKRNGYIFMGWANTEDASSPMYNDKDSITLTSDRTLYAVWVSKDSSNLVTITFHPNYGSDNTYVQYCLLGGSSLSDIYRKLLPNEFVRDGYVFEGWAKASDSSKVDYEDEDTFSNLLFIEGSLSNPTLVKNVDFYALWTDSSKLIITYNRNYSSSDTECFTEEFSVIDNKATYNIAECPYEAEDSDHVFACWYNDVYPGETINFEDEKVRKITYKALWISKTDSFGKVLKYYKDFSETDYFEQYYNWSSQDALRIKDCPWTVEKAEFAGWSRYTNSSEPDYKAGDKISTFGATSSLYALWSRDITITFNANNGTDETYTLTVKSCTPVTLPDSYFTYGDNKPVYWSTNKDSSYSSRDYQFNSDYYFSEDTTLYAIWANPITVTFNSNGGDQQDVVVASYAKLPVSCPDNFTRTGYTFLGFSTKTTGGTEIGEKCSPSNSITYYAVWSKPITIKMYPGYEGADPEVVEEIADSNKFYHAPHETYASGNFARETYKKWVRENYSIKDWKVGYSDGTTKSLSSITSRSRSEFVFSDDAESLTAIWYAPITIVFHANNGTDETKTQIIIKKSSSYLTSNTFTYEGYKFLGWARTSDATHPYYSDENYYLYSEPEVEKTEHLYAVWQQK